MTGQSVAPFVSALGKLIGTIPAYTLSVTKSNRVGEEGWLRVERPEDLKPAMEDWRRSNAGYSPRIHADGEGPCLARWSRWNTCE
jgi:hypothetical protein